MTKVTVAPWEVNFKCSLVPSEKHIFVFEFSRFSNCLKMFQLLSHVCMNMAIQTANVHWSPAGSILFFTSQGGWTTFVTRLHEYDHPDCKCSLVPYGKHTFFIENSPLNVDVDLALCFPCFRASLPWKALDVCQKSFTSQSRWIFVQ